MPNQDSKNHWKSEVETSFLVLGLGSLLPWNALLSQFDFFITYQKNYNPQTIYPNMNFLLNVALQFLLLLMPKFMSYKSQLWISQLISLFSLAVLPIVVIYLDQSISFYICCGIMLFFGVANALSSSAMFGWVSFLPVENVISLSTGQGISGVFWNLIRFALLFFLGDSIQDMNTGVFIFFGVSGFVMLITIYYLLRLYKNEYFIQKLSKSGELTSQQIEGLSAELNEIKNTEEGIELKATVENTIVKEPEKKEFSLLNLMCKLADINLLTLVTCVVTFTLFPGAAITPQVFGMSIGWKINTIMFIFNSCDTIGKKLVAYFKPTKALFYTITFTRCALLASFPLVCYAGNHALWDANTISVLAIVNVVLLSLTSGFNLTICFALAPDQVESELKGKAGSSVSLSLITGIFLGTFVAMPMGKVLAL